MSDLVGNILNKIKTLKVPSGPGTQGDLKLILGIINFFLFGIGTIIAGALNGDVADIIIGVLQLIIPFVGWIWSIIWGILMILQRNQ